MKKWMSVLIVLVLAFTGVVGYAAVPSKTTTDISKVEAMESSNGVALSDDFAIVVVEDKAPVVKELEKLFDFVNTMGSAPVAYFPAAVQDMIQAKVEESLPAGYDIKSLELNEFVSINEMGYEESYGDVTVSCAFATEYSVDQKLFALVGIYSGAMDQAGEYLVDWVVMEAQAT